MKKQANKQTKYAYLWVIWTNYGYGWEAESSYLKSECQYSDVVRDAKEYQIAGAITCIKERRELNS